MREYGKRIVNMVVTLCACYGAYELLHYLSESPLTFVQWFELIGRTVLAGALFVVIVALLFYAIIWLIIKTAKKQDEFKKWDDYD